MLEQLQVSDYRFPSYTNLNDNLIYLDYITMKYEYEEVGVSPDLALRYKGNLYGLFREMRIEPHLHVFMMHINGYTSPVEFNGEKFTFKLAIRPQVPNN